MEKTHIHLVSDSTGGTLDGVLKASLAQFENVDTEEHLWNLVRTERQLKRVVEGISQNPGPVLFTLVDTGLATFLEKTCEKMKVPSISLLQPVIKAFSTFLGQKSLAEPGLQHLLNDEYFARMDAVDYALNHDDGQKVNYLQEADVILVGVSRTSKTPTSIYLANRGLKTANIPLVPGIPLSEDAKALKGPLFVGLTAHPSHLVEIRKNRLRQLGEMKVTNYFQFDTVEDEVRTARRLFTQMGWPVIDVSRRSVEETSAEILSLLARQKEACRIEAEN